MKAPDIKVHLIFSIVKSGIRLGACIATLFTKNIVTLALGLGIAEVVGIFEELF